MQIAFLLKSASLLLACQICPGLCWKSLGVQKKHAAQFLPFYGIVSPCGEVIPTFAIMRE